MKTAAIILSVIVARVATAGLYKMASEQTNQGVPEHVREMFINWKSEHQKGYGASAEESFRLQVFYDNYKKVNDLNAKGGAKFALNHFADLSIDEFRIGYLNYKHQEGPRENVKSLEGLEVPDHVDWEAEGATNIPAMQGKCGACYSFSSTGALEGLTFIKTGELHQLSKQQIVECSQSYGNGGCLGGNFEISYQYTAENGLVSEAQYPYIASDARKCNKSLEAQGKKYNSAYASVPPKSNNELMAAISRQPVSVAVDAHDWQFYKSGVYTNDCGYKLNHAVLAVGYGVDKETGKSFYKIKDSYGIEHGERGFVRIERTEEDKGKCGILMDPGYPTVPAVNSMDTCLKHIKTTTHMIMTALEDGLQKSWLDMAKWLMHAGSSAIQDLENCKKITDADAKAWLESINKDLPPHVQDCIKQANTVRLAVKTAKTSGKMSDWIHVVSEMDKLFAQCMLE